MRKVKLSKKSGGQALRTESIKGFAPFEPELGKSYVVLGDSLTSPGDLRQFVTSMLQGIVIHDNGYELITLNSIYTVEFLSDNDEEESLSDLPKEG